jgi:O-acetyl-ADP-ribose deacetylase (regulator of RNase III)
MNDRIEIIQGDITNIKVDAIVNAANTSLLGGGGVDGAIHRAAGPELLAECKTIGGCPTGEARITKGYRLQSRFVIHTVGPIWSGGNNDEELLLKNCYINSLQLAVENDISTIAFPNISTGVYHFPKNKAAQIALTIIQVYLADNNHLENVIFCCFDEENFSIYQSLLIG